MTELVVIAAVAQNGVIGRGSQIPWHISEDFQRFKRLTMGFPCIMGDVTYESLPPRWRPLPGRENIVLSWDPQYRPAGTTVFDSFDRAIEHVQGRKSERAFIIGGATIYRLGLQVADTLELTRIHCDYPGDVHFPEFDEAEWQVCDRVDREGLDTLNGRNVRFSFLTFRRR